MGKHIIVCSDGTGNTAVKGRGTNVFKLFEALDLVGHRVDPALTPQVAIYDDGVGTQNLKLVRIAAGAFGFGLARNVKQLYTEIVRLYDEGDALYLFGFSRGAFTVRTLVGLIDTCGLLARRKLDELKLTSADDLKRTVDSAYEAYRQRYKTWLARRVGRAPSRKAGEAFKEQHSHADVHVRFLGVWDTVDAVGLPFHLSDLVNAMVYRYKFPNAQLTDLVDRACHALAADDERLSFQPQVWDESNEDRAKPRIDQVWFAGAHSNVGGGYPKQGMSLVALDWMLAEAEREGLRINRTEREYYQDHANFDDKLYDPRSGLGVFYRWSIRDIERICRENDIHPKVHLSVMERIAHGVEGYAPGNLPARALVVYTRPYARDPVAAKEAELVLSERRDSVQRIYSKAEPRLLNQVVAATRAGKAAYYLLVISCAAIVWSASDAPPPSTWANVWGAVEALGGLMGRLIASPVRTGWEIVRGIALEQPYLIGGVIASLLIDHFADRRTRTVFSRFWYDRQQQLREALKAARTKVQQSQPPAQASTSS